MENQTFGFFGTQNFIKQKKAFQNPWILEGFF
jgi:hypothetical protein